MMLDRLVQQVGQEPFLGAPSLLLHGFDIIRGNHRSPFLLFLSSGCASEREAATQCKNEHMARIDRTIHQDRRLRRRAGIGGGVAVDRAAVHGQVIDADIDLERFDI
jgi:hypothetical protein